MISSFSLCGVGGSTNATPAWPSMAVTWLSTSTAGMTASAWYISASSAGDRAFNLRVADPYLRYQMQGVGFTWSFFTEKDRQDTHVHGAPMVEIYGVLDGRLE